MTDLELIFSMLGEASTTEIAVQQDTQGFQENKEAARAGGEIAGNARKELEEKSGRKVVSSSNFLSHQLDLESEKIKSIDVKIKQKEVECVKTVELQDRH